jgi:hypothetical protein
MIVNGEFDDAADEEMLSVDDAGIGSQFDALAALFLRDVPPGIGLVCADVG